MLRNVDEPTLTVFGPPGKANDVGVIVARAAAGASSPGSTRGWTSAEWLAERGYTAFLLKYRVLRHPGREADEGC